MCACACFWLAVHLLLTFSMITRWLRRCAAVLVRAP